MINRNSLTWVGAGVAFVLYPALRPYADETGMPGLLAMSTDRWLVAHLVGMLGFVLLAVAVASLAGTARLATTAVVLLLPYYGGEAFGLHAIGRYAVATGDTGVLTAVDGFRYQPVALAMFGVGLVLLAVVGVRLARSTWASGGVLRLAGLATGLGLALYLPQFYGTPGVRIAHGALLALGCVAIGLASRRTPDASVVSPEDSADALAVESPAGMASRR